MRIEEIITEGVSGQDATEQALGLMRSMLHIMNKHQVVSKDQYTKIKKQIFRFQIEANINKATKASINKIFNDFKKYYEEQIEN